MNNKKILMNCCLVVFIASVLTGCGAPKPPQPSGFKVSITEFAKQRKAENEQKLKEAKLEAKLREMNQQQTNFRFGYEELEQTP